MELHTSYSFFSIPMESLKLLPTNGKLTVFIVVISMLLYVTLSSLLGYLVNSVAIDMINSFRLIPTSFDARDHTRTTGLSPPMFDPMVGKEDVTLFITIDIVYFLVIFVVLFFSALSMIIVAAASYKAKSLSLKELFSSMWRTWSRALVTSMYVLMLVMVYFFISVILVAPLVIYNTSLTLGIAVGFAMVAFVSYLYLSVPWALAIVVSVVEETSSGFDALGKAEKLVKGKRTHGFFLNVACCVVIMIIIVGFTMMSMNKWVWDHVRVSEFFLQGVVFLPKFFMVVVYTVLYFQVKKIHGEEVELYKSITSYTKLPTTIKGSDMS